MILIEVYHNCCFLHFQDGYLGTAISSRLVEVNVEIGCTSISISFISLCNLRTVMIQCGGMDAASSLFMHWCRLWLWCMDVPGRWYHHIGKVTEIKLSRLVGLADDSSRHLPAPVHTIWGWWWSDVAVWMQPVAYSCTDVDFDSDVWMCLDVDITTLAKSP